MKNNKHNGPAASTNPRKSNRRNKNKQRPEPSTAESLVRVTKRSKTSHDNNGTIVDHCDTATANKEKIITTPTNNNNNNNKPVAVTPPTPTTTSSLPSPHSGRTYLGKTYKPTELDVLCGRGRGPHVHSGNVRFRAMVAQQSASYIASCSRQDKSWHVVELVRLIRKGQVVNDEMMPGRFLDFDKKQQEWYDVGNQRARSKVGHAFRDSQFQSNKKAKATKVDATAPVETRDKRRDDSKPAATVDPVGTVDPVVMTQDGEDSGTNIETRSTNNNVVDGNKPVPIVKVPFNESMDNDDNKDRDGSSQCSSWSLFDKEDLNMIESGSMSAMSSISSMSTMIPTPVADQSSVPKETDPVVLMTQPSTRTDGWPPAFVPVGTVHPQEEDEESVGSQSAKRVRGGGGDDTAMEDTPCAMPVEASANNTAGFGSIQDPPRNDGMDTIDDVDDFFHKLMQQSANSWFKNLSTETTVGDGNHPEEEEEIKQQQQQQQQQTEHEQDNKTSGSGGVGRRVSYDSSELNPLDEEELWLERGDFE